MLATYCPQYKFEHILKVINPILRVAHTTRIVINELLLTNKEDFKPNPGFESIATLLFNQKMNY